MTQDFTQKPETTEQSANKAKYLKIPPWLIRFLGLWISAREANFLLLSGSFSCLLPCAAFVVLWFSAS